MTETSSGLRFKGQTLRLMAAVLVGGLVLLAGGLLGLALVSTALAAAAAFAVVWITWLLIRRAYFRRFRPSP